MLLIIQIECGDYDYLMDEFWKMELMLNKKSYDFHI